MSPSSDKKPDLDRIGLFSEATYVSSKEPFSEKKNDGILVGRGKGKQFQTSPPKRGHDTRDVYFDKEFIRLFENEPYTDLVVLRRRYRLQQKEKNITTAPFKPSSVPPKPSGSGSLWGTIEQQWPLPTKELPTPPPAPPKGKPESKPNFLTKPPKKGSGYGYPNVTIGKPYEYMTDPYDSFLEAAKKDRLESKKKMIGERPFISSSARLEFFNSFAGLIGTGVSPEQNAKSPSGKPPRRLVPIFRPAGISKSYPVRSIIEATCPIAPPPWLQDAIANTVAALS
ncbi:hypothetical protein HDU76_005890 [Blyttiomyces sp. JEL0837]|nr:hypothetical protein HDU76_005890 [Blyttiomyces sp. JEL0837]